MAAAAAATATMGDLKTKSRGMSGMAFGRAGGRTDVPEGVQEGIHEKKKNMNAPGTPSGQKRKRTGTALDGWARRNGWRRKKYKENIDDQVSGMALDGQTDGGGGEHHAKYLASCIRWAFDFRDR